MEIGKNSNAMGFGHVTEYALHRHEEYSRQLDIIRGIECHVCAVRNR